MESAVKIKFPTLHLSWLGAVVEIGERTIETVALKTTSPVKMFCSSRQHGRSSRQQTPGPLAC